MASSLSCVIVDCTDMHSVAQFWAAVLGVKVAADQEEGFVSLAALPGGLIIAFQNAPERKTVKNRVHLDMTPSGTTQEGEVARLEGLGATRADVGQPPDAAWVVMRDPEGNEFCVLRPSVRVHGDEPASGRRSRRHR